MMAYRNPWKNSFTIRLISVIDMAFAGLLVAIYLQKFLLPLSHENITPSRDNQFLPSLKLFLLAPIIFNAFQAVMAYNLFTAAGKRCEPIIAFAKANTWFQFAAVMLVLLLIKLFLVLWYPYQGSIGRRDIFGVSLIVIEVVFKVLSLFIVKEFTDDLKGALNMAPTPQYYCIYTTPLVQQQTPGGGPPTAGVPNFNTTTCNSPFSPCTTNTNNLLQICTRDSCVNPNRNSAIITVV